MRALSRKTILADCRSCSIEDFEVAYDSLTLRSFKDPREGEKCLDLEVGCVAHNENCKIRYNVGLLLGYRQRGICTAFFDPQENSNW